MKKNLLYTLLIALACASQAHGGGETGYANGRFFTKYGCETAELPKGNPEHLKQFTKTGECQKCDLRGFNITEALKQYRGGMFASLFAFLGLRQNPVDLRNSNLKNANLENANLEGALLKFVNLSKSNLKGANLRNARFYGARLDNTNCTNSDLEQANFDSSYFLGTNFTNANLKNSTFQNPLHFSFINFKKANLEGVDLTDVDLVTTYLKGAKIDKATLNVPFATFFPKEIRKASGQV